MNEREGIEMKSGLDGRTTEAEIRQSGKSRRHVPTRKMNLQVDWYPNSPAMLHALNYSLYPLVDNMWKERRSLEESSYIAQHGFLERGNAGHT